MASGTERDEVVRATRERFGTGVRRSLRYEPRELMGRHRELNTAGVAGAEMRGPEVV